MPRQPLAIHDEGLITETLDAIAAERGNFNRSFDLVDEVIRKFGEAGLVERLYTAIPRERPWEDIADLFGILIWSTGDNGGALMRTMEQWLLDGSDLRQVQIALHLDVYPLSSPTSEPGTMERGLRAVGAKFPEAAEQCRYLVESFRRPPQAWA
jgi:hypothetical protein